MGQKLDSIDETRIFLRPPAQTAQDPSLLGAEGQPRAGILARHLDHLLFLHVIVALLAPHGRVGARQVRQQRAVDPTLIEAPQEAQTVLLQARQWLQDDRRLASCCPYLGSPTSGSSMMRGSFSLAALDVGEPGGDAGGEKGSYSTAGTASGSEKSAKLGRRRPGGSKDLRWPSKSWLRLAPLGSQQRARHLWIQPRALQSSTLRPRAPAVLEALHCSAAHVQGEARRSLKP